MNLHDQKHATHVSFKSMGINLLLCVMKMVLGLMIGAVSLISDGVHSLSDIFSTVVVLVGIKISNKPADKSHPYGHEKIETVIAFLLGLMLLVIGGEIAYKGIIKIVAAEPQAAQQPLLVLAGAMVAVISIVLKEWMYHYTMKCAVRINSNAMRADAWHHRADALSSVGSLVGVIGLWLGYPVVDAVACLIIALFIFKAAFDIIKEALANMVDSTCSEDTIKQLKCSILSIKEVKSIDVLKTRLYGSKIYVDLEVSLDSRMSFVQSHYIASRIHDVVEEDNKKVKHCMVHVNPA